MLPSCQRAAALASVLLLLLYAGRVPADSSYNCAKGVVSVGDSTYTIRKKCGQASETENLAGGGAESTEEFWYYGGSSKIPYRFHIRGGKLIDIERLNR